MVLVAVTGPVGSGKSSVLSSLAQWAKGNVRSVDGFIALSFDREDPQKGAARYVVQQIASGKELPFARHDKSFSPPYQIDHSTLDELALWAASLSKNRPLSLLILDEFGPLEARGEGHMRYWESLQGSKPEVVILAVRDNSLEEIQNRLKIPFDLIVDTASPDALVDLQALVLHHSDWTRVGQFGAAAGGFEATVGSALHASRIPFTGLLLSIVQSVIMMYTGDRLTERSRVLWVSVISAGLKALSPYGGRLRPMLAITMQGFLFTLGTTVFGWNLVGILIGGWFVGAWAALQGIVLQYLIIGDNLFPAIDIVIRWIAEKVHLAVPGIITLSILWAFVCGALSSLVTLFAWLRRHRLPARLSALLSKGAGGIPRDVGTPTIKAAIRKGLHDLLRPMFWAPVAVVALIIVATGSTWEQAMWIVVRAITVGWVLFALARLFDPRKLVRWLRRKGHWGPAMALSRALRPGLDKVNDESEKKSR